MEPLGGTATNEKLTKITTLRLAMKYRNLLSTALGCSIQSDRSGAVPDFLELEATLPNLLHLEETDLSEFLLT